MQKGQIINNTLNVHNATNSPIQQGTINSTQNITTNTSFDYEQVFKVLEKISKYTSNADFHEDFGDKSNEIKQLIIDASELIANKEDPSKIKTILTTIKDLSIGVTGSLIATGIHGLITQLPIW